MKNHPEEGASALVLSPSVHVIASTQFNQPGMNGWIEMRGLETFETYIGSPIQNLRERSYVQHEGQDESEGIAEFAGRFCYDSFLKGRDTGDYIENILEMRHGSVLEHVNFTLAIQGVSRALTHELIRHRAGFAVSQESQRYVDAEDMRFVVPPILLHLFGADSAEVADFEADCEKALGAYKSLQATIAAELEAAEDVKAKTVIKKRANEAARALLPNAAETKLVWTGNLRALRHFCELRGDEHADLEIRRLAALITEVMMVQAPYAFVDAQIHDGDFGVDTVSVKHTKV